MKTPHRSNSQRRAFTLLEMTVVIMVLMALISSGLFVSKKYDEWKLGKQAAESLRAVYTAQRMYLSDNPTVAVSSLTSTMLIPCLPNQPQTVMPTVKSLTGATLTIIITVMPPVVNAGSGTAYDPSGSTKDSLWDVGE